jgi:hypothetical protein
MKLMNERDGNIYSLVSNDAAVRPGERLTLKGEKGEDDRGRPTFLVEEINTDHGACSVTASR